MTRVTLALVILAGVLTTLGAPACPTPTPAPMLAAFLAMP